MCVTCVKLVFSSDNASDALVAGCELSDMLSRRQVTWLCLDTSEENENSVWTLG